MKEVEPLVSIIMPLYNSERYLRETIESVFSQTYSSWELILIDDGSIDSTPSQAKEFCCLDSRCKYIHQKNQGQASARNAGLSMAKGDLVAFLDHDDYWLKDKLGISVEEFFKQKQDVLFTDAYFFYQKEDLNSLSQLKRMGVMDYLYEGKDGLSHFLYQNRVPMLTVLARKEALLQMGGFRSLQISDDYFMWLALLFSGYKLRGISNSLSCHRIHDRSLSSSDRLGSRDVMFLLRQLRQEFPELENYPLQIRSWIKVFIKKGLLSNERLPFLKETLEYWGCYSREAQFMCFIKPIIPFRWFQSWLCRVL